MSTATSAYLNRPCRSLADVERTLREFRNERILAGFLALRARAAARTTVLPIGALAAHLIATKGVGNADTLFASIERVAA